MERQKVNSSNLESVGYDKNSQVLEIKFLSGDVYQYSNVPESIHYALISASSHGQYFSQNIKDVFSSRKL